jgi:hypothetical protein
MSIVRSSRLLALGTLLVVLPLAPLAAQSSTPAPTGGQRAQRDSVRPAPTLNFSGVIFGNFNYQLPTTPAQLNNQLNNAFVIDRSYLTFRMQAGDHTTIRVTTDVYQSTDSTSNAYTVRAKYAYLQYDAPMRSNGAQVTGRVGILQNVILDQIENFWLRYLRQAPTEAAGYFASADVGVAGLVTFPKKLGEVYANVVNGPGYTTREKDRFKDMAIRLTFTPLANAPTGQLFQSLTISAWGYKGALASKFVNGGTGQVGAVGQSLDRSRAGVFVGFRDPRLVLGGEFAQRRDGGETGANTLASPRGTTETSGRLVSGYTIVRPLAFRDTNGRSPFGLVARYDHVSPSTSSEGFAIAPSTSNAYHVLVAGLFWDISQKAQLALDYQESLAANNGVSASPPQQGKAYFAHFVVNF